MSLSSTNDDFTKFVKDFNNVKVKTDINKTNLTKY